ncbi:MAG: MmgE/PrpD family protein [Alphaproteobacteria bacterium]|nr:MmgE/PrpD family protein [Alphaproteobacteria bacterium]
MTGLAERAAAWLAELRCEDLPADIVADAKLRILDTLGLILGATASPIGRAVRAGALAMGQGDEARMLGYGDRTTAMAAALVNGTLAHAADFDDTHNRSVMHASAPTVATAMALIGPCALSGRELIAVVAGGIELNCRLGMVTPGAFHRSGFHPTGVIGALVAAMMAGRLYGLAPRVTASAVGIAGSQAAGLLEAYEDGSWAKTLHPGWAGHCGIAAALLARAGFTGPASVLEGRFGVYRAHVQDPRTPIELTRITDRLGTQWEARENSFKPYPCAHAIHPFIDAAIGLHAGGLRAAQIDRVSLPLSPYLMPVIAEPRAAKLRPVTPTHARASLAFCVAAALVHGRFDETLLDDAALADSAVLELAGRIDCVPDPSPPPSGQFRGIVEVATRDGRRVAGRLDHNRGSRENPMSRAELEAKFRAGAAVVFDAARADAIIAAIDGLEAAGDAAALVRLCVP